MLAENWVFIIQKTKNQETKNSHFSGKKSYSVMPSICELTMNKSTPWVFSQHNTLILGEMVSRTFSVISKQGID